MAEAEALALLTPGEPGWPGPALTPRRQPPTTWTAAGSTWPWRACREHHLGFQHGWDYCAAAVASGPADAAVLLRPATVEQIAAISRGGVRMPPKTTFFWPKPRTGMVVRELLG